MIDTLRPVSLPEGAEITLRLAGPVARARAWFIDFLLRFAVAATLPAVFMRFGEAGFGLLLLTWFTLSTLYPIFFEALWNGATPGKRICNLAVVHSDGTPIGWPAAFLRNVVRIADALPIGYAFGLISMGIDPQFRRLGDLAAGTVVIHREEAITAKRTEPGIDPVMPAVALMPLEQRAVLDFAERRPAWSDERAAELAELAGPLVADHRGAGAVAQLEAVAAHLASHRNAEHEAEWIAFAAALKGAKQGAAPAAEVPRRFRRVAADLALARDRQYRTSLLDRLHALVLGAHLAVHGARAERRDSILEALWRFVVAGFPAEVRRQWPFVVAAFVAFFGPFLGAIAALQWFPDFVHYLVDPETLARVQSMYSSGNSRMGIQSGREADTDFMMFGYYIANNVRIDLQAVAGGIFFGLGTLAALVGNGIFIGALAGHLTQVGLGENFWGFVAGHSAPELLGLVFAGAAGLRVGYALIAPGRMSRAVALRDAAPGVAALLYGAALMTVAAAFIEAFWSSRVSVPFEVKILFGATLAVICVVHLAYGGRGRGP